MVFFNQIDKNINKNEVLYSRRSIHKSRIITEGLPLPTHEYTDEEFSESDDDDVDTVPIPCSLDEREEPHLPEQIIDDTSLFCNECYFRCIKPRATISN